MGSKETKYRKKASYIRIIVMLIVLVVLVGAGYFIWTNGVGFGTNQTSTTESESEVLADSGERHIDTLTQKITKKALSTAISSQTGVDVSISDIEDTMDTEDANELDSIIDKYATTENLQEIAGTVVGNGSDVDSVMDSLKTIMDTDDVDTLEALYDKYADTVKESIAAEDGSESSTETEEN